MWWLGFQKEPWKKTKGTFHGPRVLATEDEHTEFSGFPWRQLGHWVPMKPPLPSSSMPQTSRNAEVEPHMFKALILNRPHSFCKHNEESIPGATGGGSQSPLLRRMGSDSWGQRQQWRQALANLFFPKVFNKYLAPMSCLPSLLVSRWATPLGDVPWVIGFSL